MYFPYRIWGASWSYCPNSMIDLHIQNVSMTGRCIGNYVLDCIGYSSLQIFQQMSTHLMFDYFMRTWNTADYENSPHFQGKQRA